MQKQQTSSMCLNWQAHLFHNTHARLFDQDDFTNLTQYLTAFILIHHIDLTFCKSKHIKLSYCNIYIL